MFSNAHLLESEVISNAEGDISRTSLVSTKEASLVEKMPEEEKVQEDIVKDPNLAEPIVDTRPKETYEDDKVFQPVTEPISSPAPTTEPTFQPVKDEPTVVVNVNEGVEAVPVTIDPVVGVGEGTPVVPLGGGGGFIGGGGAARSMAEEEMGEMPVVEEGGSNWWIWVALAGTGLAAWYVFGKKKKG